MRGQCRGIAVLVPSWPARDIAVGMVGPLLAACVTWWLVERTWRANPAGLSGVMMGAFAVKLVFFGVYVVFALRGLQVAVVPFIATFTLYFVGAVRRRGGSAARVVQPRPRPVLITHR